MRRPKRSIRIEKPTWSRYINSSELRVDPRTGRSVGPDGRATGVLVLPELTVTPRNVSASLGAIPSQYDMAHRPKRSLKNTLPAKNKTLILANPYISGMAGNIGSVIRPIDIGSGYNPDKAKSFIKAWYKNRVKQIRQNIIEANASMDDWDKQMRNIDEYTWYSSPKYLPKNVSRLLSDRDKDVGNVEGMTLPQYNLVYFNQPNTRQIGSSIQVHEGTHTQNPKIQSKLIRNRLKLMPGVYQSEYYDDPDEVNSRLMEFRYSNKLNPLKKYSIDEIRNMKDYGDGGISWPLMRRPLDILNRYSDDTLLFLINELASNNRRSKTNIANYA